MKICKPLTDDDGNVVCAEHSQPFGECWMELRRRMILGRGGLQGCKHGVVQREADGTWRCAAPGCGEGFMSRNDAQVLLGVEWVYDARLLDVAREAEAMAQAGLTIESVCVSCARDLLSSSHQETCPAVKLVALLRDLEGSL